MEYEKPPTSTSFSSRSTTFSSKKMRNRSHSLNYGTNAVYDGVFASPASRKSSPLVDYSEIFKGSSPSSSSIPFLDIPEINGGKVKVDVRSSKVDYTSVFGGFGVCDFAVTPKEVIVKSERKTAIDENKRNRRKAVNSSDVLLCNKPKTQSSSLVNSSDVLLCNKPKTQSSSPEVVNMKHSDVSYHQTEPRNENGTTHLNQVLTMPVLTQMVDNTSPLQKMESKTPVPLVKKEPYIVGLEEVKVSRKQSSKTEVEFQNLFGDNFTSKTDFSGEHRDVRPPSDFQRTLSGDKGASERYLGLNPGISERSQLEDDDDDSPSSPSYFDAESDVDSTAAESSAALKKAIEEAQVRMNIAKQMMERKKSGLLSHAKPKSCNDPKVENKEDQKVEDITEESRDSKTKVLDEMLNSSEQSFSSGGDQHVKRTRKQWKVPEELLTSNSDHKQEEEEPEVVKLDEEQERRARKHWELPGGLFKSIINSKPQETENLAPAITETDTKQDVQPVTENPFYTFGQLGSKLKCVVEAFTGSKASQKHETQVTECSLEEDSQENSTLNQVVEDEKSVSQEMLADIPVMETYVRKVEETPQQTQSKDETKIDEDFESKTCISTEGCSEKETEWEVINARECEDGPTTCGVEDSHENPNTTYDSLDQEGEKEIVSEPQEIFVDPDASETAECRVEDIETETPNQSSYKTHIDDTPHQRSMVSFVAENASDLGNIPNEKEEEHKAPRRRRVWKTSEDVYNLIKAPKVRKSWQLDSVEKETTVKCFLEEGVKINEAIEDKESISELANDSGLQENWNNLKQMFRQMFQTADTKDETQCLLESGEEHVDIHQKAVNENEQETAETSYSHMTGTERYEHYEVEKVSMEYNEDLEPTRETFCTNDDEVEVQGKTTLVHEPVREELEAIGMAGEEDGEDVHEAFEEAEFSEVEEIKENEYDRSETDSNISGEKFEQTHEELVEETRFDGSIDTETSRSSFETRQGDSYIEEVGLERELCDQSPERTSVSGSMEHIEETDSDSIQSGWGVVGDDDKLKSYVEESLPGQTQDEGSSQQPCKPKEVEETKEESSDEAKIDKEEHQFEGQEEEEMIRSNVEAAESSCCLPKEDEKVSVALDKDMKDKDGENCRSSTEEDGDTISEASQNEAERVDERLKKKDEAKEKERERLMVERAIREARERAFADARERAGKAAMEKAKAGARRKATSEVPRRSEKGSVEVNDKLSSAEKASMQAKLRAERAAVERALAEARERAMEKALSGKAASQAKVQSSKSFSSSGERRGSSSSNTENRSSGPQSSSNHSAKSEPVQRSKARSERHQRTSERAAEALAEKKLRDLTVQKEQAERNRVAETLDAEVKRWSSGKESNLRALLSTLQYILGAESGWKPIPLTDLVSSTAVRKAYRKATLYVHPDKLQQRGASTQQKYTCEKVFDLLKEAWNKFGADDK